MLAVGAAWGPSAWAEDGAAVVFRDPQVHTAAPVDRIAFADLDGDGRDDLVAAGAATSGPRGTVQGLFWMRGRTTARLGLRTGLGRVPEFTPPFATGDVDGDGDVDVAYLSFRGAVMLLENDGTGSMARSEWFTVTGATEIDLIDLAGDGRPEVVLANGTRVEVWSDLPSGVPSVSFVELGEPVGSSQAGDFDADGDVDLIASAGARLHLLLQVGPAQFEHAAQLPATTPFAVADLDLDGAPDVVAPRTVLAGAHDGSLSATGFDPGADSPPRLLRAADVDGDARPDLVAIGEDGVLRIHCGSVEGGFGDPVEFDLGFSSRIPSFAPPRGLRIADVDGDGVRDVIASGFRVVDLDGVPFTEASVDVYAGAATSGPEISSLAPDLLTSAGRVEFVLTGRNLSPDAAIQPPAGVSLERVVERSDTRIQFEATVERGIGSGVRSIRIENADGRAALAPFTLRSFEVGSTNGALRDTLAPARDAVTLRGRLAPTDLSPRRPFDPTQVAFDLDVGAPGAPLRVRVAREDPRWSVQGRARRRFVWRSRPDEFPRVRFVVVPARGRFALRATHFDFPGPQDGVVRVAFRATGEQGAEQAESTSTWSRTRTGWKLRRGGVR